MNYRHYPNRNRSQTHAAQDNRARDLAYGSSLLALAAGLAAAMILGFSAQANAQSVIPSPPDNLEIDTYACSPHSTALLSQVELMKVAGAQLQERWAEQGFTLGGNNAQDNGAHVFAGANQAAVASYNAGNAAAPQPVSYDASSYGVSGVAAAPQPGVNQAMLNGDPAGVRAGLNQMVNSVDPINPSYERFFQAHPSMQEHLRQAQEMGVGPGPVQIDPRVVAQQFGLAYDGQILDPYSFIPPNTGSVFSKVALQIRSFFYSR